MKDYKEILKGVINIINTTKNKNDISSVICAYIYEQCPEFIENEDERIRKDMIIWLKGFIGEASGVGYTEDEIKERIAWLEKQSEHKEIDWDEEIKKCKANPLYFFDKYVTIKLKEHKHVDIKPHIPDGSTDYDKGYEEAQKYLSERGFDIPWNDGDVFVDERYILQTVANILAWGDEHPKQKDIIDIKPKFDIGDWITNDKGHSYLIAAIDDGRYLFEIGGYTHEQLNWEYIENVDSHYHLWTIEDAKAGDILVSSYQPFIYNGKFNNILVGAYCGLNVINRFVVSKEEVRWTFNKDIKPATKEQRDILFKVMSEAWYMFDFEKRELKRANPDVQSNKDEYTETAIITRELLERNGFKYISCKFQDCYYKKHNESLGFINLYHDKTINNTEWLLDILKCNGDDDENRLVKAIFTVDELQDCLDKMNINLKILK